jgi:hypothetical protein
LEGRGYVARQPDATDRRRMRPQVTDQGIEMLREGATIVDELRAQWEKQVGADAIEELGARCDDSSATIRSGSIRPDGSRKTSVAATDAGVENAAGPRIALAVTVDRSRDIREWPRP